MFRLEDKELYKIYIDADSKLVNAPKIKFERNLIWRKKYLQNIPAIYALYENENLVYIGETGDLLKRMSDVTRTVNHSFRKEIGAKKFEGLKSSKKFDDITENKLDNYFDESLFISFIEVDFGRLEIETYLVDKYQKQIFNS